MFDGAPPILKAETLMTRRRARLKAQGDLHAIAERILLSQLKLKTIAEAKKQLKDGKLELGKALMDNVLNPQSSADKNSEAMDVDEEELQQEEEPKEDLDSSLLHEDEAHQFAHQFTADELRSIDATGEFVSDLPRETQLALLRQMKAAHRGHVGALSLSSPKRLSGESYSTLQVEQLVQKGEISRRLESVRGEIGSDTFKPIASDPNIRYRLTSPPPTPLKSRFGQEYEEGGDSSTQVQRVVMSSNGFGVASTSPPPSSNLQSSPTAQTSKLPSPNQGPFTPPPARSVAKGQQDPRSPSRLPSASVSYYRLPASKGEQKSLIHAMVELDPDMALAEMVADVEEADDEEQDDAELDEAEERESPSKPSKPVTMVSSTQFGAEISDDGLEIIEMTSSAPAYHPEPKSTSSPALQAPPAIEIVTIDDSVFEDDDLLEIEFEDVGGADEVPQATEEESNMPSSPQQLNEASHHTSPPGTPQRAISPPQSPKHISSSTPASPIVESPPQETTIDDSTPFGADVLDEDEVTASHSEAPSTPQVSSTPHKTTARQSSTLSTSQRSASSDETMMLAPRALSFSVNTSQASVGPTSFEKLKDIPTAVDLDASVDSQKLNYSVISEEETQRVSTKSYDDLEAELRREVASLEQEAKQGQNQTVVLTSEAVDEAKELLRLFGIPFVQSPSEADAQCAALQMLGLVDGVVSDDSDILVFGGDVVFRHAFSSQHDLELYNIEDIQSELGLDHDGLIFLALLLGGDYAEGLHKVGPRAALDIVTEFPGAQGMLDFKSWLHFFQQDETAHHNDRVFATPSAPFLKKHGKLLRSLKLPESFPNPSVLDAYQNPSIDPSREAFSWGWPNLAGLRQFALDKFGWTKERVDSTLLPIIKIYTAALNDAQPKIETFFSNVSIHGYKPSKSKSPKQPAARMRDASSGVTASTEDATVSTVTADEVEGARNRKKRGRAKRAALPSTVTEADESQDETTPKRTKTTTSEE